MRVFLDANILFSASFTQSRLADLLDELQHHAVLLTNDYARTEAERNVAAKLPKRLSAHRKFVSSLELVPTRLFALEFNLAKKDLPILCGAIAGKADFLVTGDKKDFGHLFGQTVRDVKIVTVQMLFVELIERGIIRQS